MSQKPRQLSEYVIVQDLGEKVCKRIAQEVIAGLEEMNDALLSGDDSGLETVWEEICVQQQVEESMHWSTYDQMVRDFADGVIANLEPFELDAAWLITDEGSDWSCEDEDSRESYPVRNRDIVNYVVENVVYEEARSSQNPNVLNYQRRKDEGESEGGDEEE